MGEHKTNYCGELLLRWRTQRRLSRQAVALEVGLSPSTISNWESGRFLPRLPELLSLLNYLEVPAILQQEAVRQLQRPRSLQWLQQETSNDAFVQRMGLPPSPHDLIRCLRVRSGKTIEEIAQSLGISRRTLIRWENGDTWPDTSALHLLCHTLGAHPEEMLALTHRQLDISETHKPLGAMTLEELEHTFWTIHAPPHYPERVPLTELTYLSLAHAVWPYARYSTTGRELLFNIYTALGSHHVLANRPRAAQLFLKRALAFLQDISHFVELSSLAISRAASVEKTPQASRKLVETYLPLIEAQPNHHGWLLSDISLFYREEGNLAASDAFSRRALSVTQEGGWEDMKMRYLDRARWLIDAGRPEEAFSFLPSISSTLDPIVALTWARAAIVSNRLDDAYTYYQRASEMAVDQFRYRADVAPFIDLKMKEGLQLLQKATQDRRARTISTSRLTAQHPGENHATA